VSRIGVSPNPSLPAFRSPSLSYNGLSLSLRGGLQLDLRLYYPASSHRRYVPSLSNSFIKRHLEKIFSPNSFIKWGIGGGLCDGYDIRPLFLFWLGSIPHSEHRRPQILLSY